VPIRELESTLALRLLFCEQSGITNITSESFSASTVGEHLVADKMAQLLAPYNNSMRLGQGFTPNI
jgi:hypothetical protein